jgi:hypothetical protein
MDILDMLYWGRELGLDYTINGEQVSITGPETPTTLAIVQRLAEHKTEVLTAYHLTCRYHLLMSKPLLTEETQELFYLADTLRLPKPIIQRIHLGNISDPKFGTIEEIPPDDWRPQKETDATRSPLLAIRCNAGTHIQHHSNSRAEGLQPEAQPV